MMHWYTIAARPEDADPLLLAGFVLAVAGSSEWLILAAPGLVAIEGIYHGPDERIKPGPLPADLAAVLKDEAARLGRGDFDPTNFWAKTVQG